MNEKEISRRKYYKCKKNQFAPVTDHANDYVFFWKSGSPFSNWHPAKYVHDGIEFNCSEQGIMWSKAMLFDDENVASAILRCNSTEQKQMKSLGRDVNHFKERVWKNNKMSIYHTHCYEKFSQNSPLREKILETTGKILAEASPDDRVWGIGLHEKNAKIIIPKKWPGENLLGLLLNNIRDQLTDETI